MRTRRATHQDNLRIVELLLHAQDCVGLSRVLVPREVLLRLREVCRTDNAVALRGDRATHRDGASARLPRALRHLEHELIQQLVQQRKRHTDGVFAVRYNDACDPVDGGPRVDMRGKVILLDRLPLRRLRALRDRLRMSIVCARREPSP